MKIAVVGIGGIGGLVGGVLQQQGADVVLISRGENLKAIKENGLRVESALLGDFTVRPHLATDKPEEAGVVDAVVVAVKGQQLEQACRQSAVMIGPQTTVVPLLNGVIVSDQMEAHLPPCDLADGLIKVFSHLAQPGVIRQTAGRGLLVFGKKGGGKSPTLDQMAALLTAGGLNTEVSEEILAESWIKYALMCGNSVGFLHFDGPADVVREKDPELRFLAETYAELVAVAAATGVDLPENLIDKNVEEFKKHPAGTMSSLYRDISSGKDPADTELQHIVGRMVELGRQYGVPTPHHAAVLASRQ